MGFRCWNQTTGALGCTASNCQVCVALGLDILGADVRRTRKRIKSGLTGWDAIGEDGEGNGILCQSHVRYEGGKTREVMIFGEGA